MADFAPAQTRYQFDSFCLDVTRRVLLRNGNPLALTGKSVDTLLVLIERAGATVTKRELIDAVWGHAAIEENNLNQCISAVRKALGEQRGKHKYILTVTGVGYRFVAPVRQTDASATTLEAPAPAVVPRWRSYARAGLVSAAVLCLAVSAIYLWRSNSAQAARRRTTVILPLKVLPETSGNAWLSTAVGDMLYHELAGRERLRIISPDETARMERDLPHRSSASQSLRDIRAYTQADFALGGTITVLSAQANQPLRIDLHVQDLRTGDITAAASWDGSEQQLFAMIRPLGERVRQSLGIPNATATASSSPIPSRQPAMQLYAAGIRAFRSSDFLTAKDRLLQAVEADPSNALCYSALSSAWHELGYESNAADAARRAFDLSSSLGQLDRLSIEGRYRFSIHDWPRAAEIYAAIWKLVPDSIEDASALSEAYRSSGKQDEARRVITALRNLPAPLRDDPRIDLLETNVVRSTWSDYQRIAQLAAIAARKARERQMLDLYANARMIEANALKHQGAHAAAEAARNEGKRVCQDLHDFKCLAWVFRSEGNTLLQSGKLRLAEVSYGQALAFARQIGNHDEPINELNGLGLIHYWMQDFKRSDADFREALRMSEEARESSTETLINYCGLLMATGRLDEARRSIDSALAQARAFHEIDSEANSLLLRAQLDVLAGDPRAAVASARNALAVAKKSASWGIGADADLELARALAATGDTPGARHAMRDAAAIRGTTTFQDFEIDFYRAQAAFYATDYSDAERLARQAAEQARAFRVPEFEARTESLLALALLAQDRVSDAHAIASRLASPPQGSDRSLSSLEARLATLATEGRLNPATHSIAGFEDLAAKARQAGYVEMAFEIRLAAARSNPTAQPLRQLESEAQALGYVSVASRARSLYLTH
ncbi:MAG: winged helix-turn-helix domain-containing protein [Bryobacteraceae bacterium]